MNIFEPGDKVAFTVNGKEEWGIVKRQGGRMGKIVSIYLRGDEGKVYMRHAEDVRKVNG